MSTDEITTLKFEYTNTCTCTVYNEELEEYTEEPSDNCYGDCWEFVVEDFSNITDNLFNQNETNWWKITGFRLWDGDHSGFVYAKTPLELLRGMTVNSEWIMRGEVFDDHINYSLSHHDAPTGSSTKLTIVSESEREDYGLY